MKLLDPFKGIVVQSALLTAIFLPLGFNFMAMPDGSYQTASEIMLWPIHAGNKMGVLLVDPLRHPLMDYIYLSAFTVYVGWYLIVFAIHMTVKKRWGWNPRKTPNPNFEDPRDQPDPGPTIQYNLNDEKDKKGPKEGD